MLGPTLLAHRAAEFVSSADLIPPIPLIRGEVERGGETYLPACLIGNLSQEVEPNFDLIYHGPVLQSWFSSTRFAAP